MIPEIGVSRSSGFTSYFSLDQTRTLSFYRRQGSSVEHRPIDDQIRDRISARDDRIFVAIIEGECEFMQRHRESLVMPDLVVFVSSLENLRRMGVKVVDENWQPGDTPIDLNDHLPGRK